VPAEKKEGRKERKKERKERKRAVHDMDGQVGNSRWAAERASQGDEEEEEEEEGRETIIRDTHTRAA
jgi:hypothetical protein